jgi:predicted aminopeptidase
MWACPFVEQRQDLPALSFDEVRADLARSLEDQKRQELFNTWFAKKLASARVRVAGAYGDWDPALPGVVA